MNIPQLLSIWLAISVHLSGVLASPDDSDCPGEIETLGEDVRNWTPYGDWNRFLTCHLKPRLFSYDVGRAGSDAQILGCTSFRGEIMSDLVLPWGKILANKDEHHMAVDISWTDISEDAIPGQATSALLEISAYLSINLELDDGERPTTLFAQYGDTTVGVYIGGRIDNAGAVYVVLQRAIRRIREHGVGRSLFFQLCAEAQSSSKTLGIYVDTRGGVEAITATQQAVETWSGGRCLQKLASSDVVNATRVWMSRSKDATEKPVLPDAGTASVETKSGSRNNDTITTNNNNTTSILHSRSVAKLQPRADGSCATYFVKDNTERCHLIADAHKITVKELIGFNEGRTWGFTDCEHLQVKSLICVSRGDPPMPEPAKDAECGPLKEGTPRPTNGTKLADLNPCPLKACCSQWGFCGLSEKHCKQTGTVPGASGCVSNCGTPTIKGGSPVGNFISIAYFEAWNQNRPCLRMDVDAIDTRKYTHIHFAFGRVTHQYTVDMSGMEEQFEKFVAMKGVKRIISFGGWDDSTLPDRFMIFRQAVEPTDNRRLTFAKNLADFVIKHNLDGIDIDWEYPAAPDIPDIPKGEAIEGDNYLKFLQLLRALLPGKSVSIAAPASYWYLKGIPIEEISKSLDYIVYMTYDLHGQWDYDNEWSQVGCATGNCLQSHVNYTETIEALALVTRAGVPASKVIVGVTSYGRSFKMSQKGCTDPGCKFLGPESQAKKGPCTGTAGYISNAEIDMIIRTNPNHKTWYDGKTMANYMVYDDVEWVSYMDAKTKQTRREVYRLMGFGGVTDWAVDLAEFAQDDFMTPGVFKSMAMTGSCGWRFGDGFDCRHPALVNTDWERKRRWDDLGAACAWRDLVAHYAGMKNPPRFSTEASKFFAGPNPFTCYGIGTDGCAQVSLLCPISDAQHSGPAGKLILESFITVNRLFTTLHTALTAAMNNVEGVIENFMRDFAVVPVKTDLRQFKMAIDVIGMGLGLIMVPFFHNVLKGRERSKDATEAVTHWGLTLIKDNEKEKDTGEIEAQIRDSLRAFFDGWRAAVSTINSELFSGGAESNRQLEQLIRDGTQITGAMSEADRRKEDSLAEGPLRKQAEKSAFAQLIPKGWLLSGWRPVVVSGGGCDDAGATKEFMPAGTADKTGVCHEGTKYHLVAADVPFKYGTPNCFNESPAQNGSPPPCWDEGDDPKFKILPGNEKLRERSDTYAGISLDDLVIGSVESWKHNGRKNGMGPIDFKQTSSVDRLFDKDGEPINIRAAGIFRIPVCSAKDAYATWKAKGGKWEGELPVNFPCP